MDLPSSTLTETCVYANALYCRVDGSASFDLATEFLKAFGIAADLAGANPKQIIDTILTRLHRERWLVVIDNLESLMQDDSAKAKSAEVGDLLDRLAYANHKSQIIITSRKPPADLHDRRGNAAMLGYVREVLVTGISDADSIKLLQKLGMQDSEEDLAWIAGRVKGNVSILNLLAKLYANKPGQLSDEPEWITDSATTIVKKQWEKQGAAAQALLERMCVLRIGMDAVDLTTLRLLQSDGGAGEFTKEAKKATEGLLRELVNCGLVEENYDRSAKKSYYTLHRLIAETLQAIFEDDLKRLWWYAARLYGSFDLPENESGELDFRSFEDMKSILEEFHFYWLSGTDRESLIRMVIGAILPKLRQWCYWDLAEEWLNKCLEVRTELGDRAGMATSWGCLGDLARNRGNYAEAERLYNQALEVRTELNDRAGMAAIWGTQGDLARHRGNYAEAERLYNQALEVRTELNDRAGMAAIWGTQGDLARHRGNYAEAERLYNQALEVRTELNDRAGMAAIWGCLGENELERGNLPTAETWLNKALTAMEEFQNIDGMAELNWDLARLYRAKCDEKTAQTYYSISHKLYTKLGSKGDLEKIKREWSGG